jgi:pimeloyl-ACP methyl ester carboxylesterase
MTESTTLTKQHIRVGKTTVAYLDEGDGPPLLLVHGCPFSSFIWRKLIARLRDRFRCIAPDLLGLGDTETPPEADWSLPAQAAMIIGLLDALGLDQVDIVAHDHGAATAQLIAAEHPARIRRLVITNAEAYDNWPSRDELPFIRATQLPVLGRLVLWAWGRPRLLGYALRSGKAVHDPAVLTPELLRGYAAANLADPRRRAKTRRFLAGQLDPANHRATAEALAGLRAFDHPTLIVWGEDDPHFGPDWGRRLRDDIPGAGRLELLAGTGHLLMEERPDDLARLVADFLTDPNIGPDIASEPPAAVRDEGAHRDAPSSR